MSQSVKDLFNTVLGSSHLAGTKNYLSANADQLTQKVVHVTEPYKTKAKENVETARTFVSEKVKEVRTADSLSAVVDILVGVIMTVIRFIISVSKQVRQCIYAKYQTKYIKAQNQVGNIVERVKAQAVQLPNSPVGKRVEEVSKKVLGTSRHDQAVDFIKSNVIPTITRGLDMTMPTAQKSPAGSVTSSMGDFAPTEASSVAATSPRDVENTSSRQKQQSKQNQPRRK